MNPERRIWYVASAALVCLLLLSCRMVYWQLARKPELMLNAQAQVSTATPTKPRATATSSMTPAATAKPGQTAVANKIYMPLVAKEGQSPGSAPPVAVALATAPTEATATTAGTPAVTLTPLATGPATLTVATTPTGTVDFAAMTRGAISDRNGRRLAYDLTDSQGKRVRFYTEPSLAHVVGYVSGARAGVTGIEQSYDKMLWGLNEQGQPQDPAGRGNDITLTIDSQIQRKAAEVLNGKAGAMVVMDAQTGAVLAMVSTPYFDPNRILAQDYVSQLDQCNGAVTCRQALFNRAAQGWYTPGSTWKTVTLIAALESGQVTPQTVFDFGAALRDKQGHIYYVYTVDGFSIVDPNHVERQLNLVRAYAVSANAAFGRIGNEMAADVMIKTANQLGFGRSPDGAPPLEIDTSAPRLASDPQALYTNNPLRASTAIGQGELQVSPLSMALLAAAVVNGGHIPAPHLVQAVNNASGAVVAGESIRDWLPNAIQPETAKQVHDMMIEVVQNGSGFRAKMNGLIVGGKTGTAQVGANLAPHAWFMGFVQDQTRAVVITVIVENGGEGSLAAAPLFAQVADVVMHHQGEPVLEIVPTPKAP